MQKHTMRGLYAVTPNWDDTQKLLTSTELIIQGGAQMVQYRHKTADDALRKEQASALLDLCHRYHVPFIINDDVELCVALDTDGVHLGGTDESIAEARARLGHNKIIGASCYGSLALAHAAAKNGASYVAFGGFYPSLVKQYEVSTSLSIVAFAKAVIDLPIVVIGGMTIDNCGVLIEQGADMVAAISSIYTQSDSKQAAEKINALFNP